ncbi:glycosyltransferase family 4 protein [Alkalihalobacillus deserti]|uniref:glycosyltransferase family 4 protein n=1 Tax=Alkalihalobacillus deserti TaxID=2879466 RepID=UPI001D151A19|nr:glycosyltransferase family 4 protein [Alkalihalobacillus deserti]
MKILMICTEKLPVPAVRGGAIQTYIDGVSLTLAKNHDLTILGTTDPSLPNDEKVNNIRYVRTPGGLLEDYRDGVKEFLQSAPDYDVIHIFNRPRLVLAVRECAPKARLILSMHNDMFKREKIEPEEAVAAIEQLDKIITVSDYIGKTIADLFPQAASKLKTIYSGVDIDRFVPPHSKLALDMRKEIRTEHNLEGKKVILFAGRLSANKGADILVQAMPLLAKKHPDIALVLVGSKWFSVNEVSDYVAYVRALAARLPIPVVNTGFVAPSEIQKWFAAADVFVCPSQWQEPLARVHYEAMASGLPVITTARGGNPEVITPNENGFVVEQPEDPQSFADLLAPLLSDPKLCKRLGLKGRELAEEKFTWERVINDIADVWNEVEHKIKNNIALTSEEQSNDATATIESPTNQCSDIEADSDVTTKELELNTEIIDEQITDEASQIFSKEDVFLEPSTVELDSEESLNEDIPLGELLTDLDSKDLTEQLSLSDLSPLEKTLNNFGRRKRVKLKLLQVTNNPFILDSILSNIRKKAHDNAELNDSTNKIISDFENLLKGQFNLDNSPSTKEYIQSINDITTAKLFYKIANKRKQRRSR